ncbi:hypothetical protein [Lactobacillus sp. ESL0677]|nr:hypothetical protein [Lactobacillus sp. ESL0677]WEV36946.1 hypothetical protein OZX76_09455 [Lactobacillus sp. ESL0677]
MILIFACIMFLIAGILLVGPRKNKYGAVFDGSRFLLVLPFAMFWFRGC